MANWKEYKTNDQKVTWGVGLTLDGTGRFPLIAKRIWSTLADAQAWIDDTSTNSTATPGLTLTVIADTDSTKNGVYFVESIADGTNAGKLVKLGESSSAESVKDALDKLTAAVGVSDVDELKAAFAEDFWLSGNTDSIVEALGVLDGLVDSLDKDVRTQELTAVTFNGVAGTITSGGTLDNPKGTAIALTADTSDIKVADDFTTTTYPTAFTSATAIAVDDTVSAALNKVEKTVSGLAQTEIDDKKALNDEIDAIETGAGLGTDGKYTATSTANYIKDATSLVDADNKLDTELKAVADEVAKNKVASANKTITVTTSATSTDLAVNIDGVSLSAATDGKIGTTLNVAKLSDDEIKALSDGANVREAYKLVANDSTAIGEIVKIYKDSSVKSVEFTETGATGESGQFLKIIYILASGEESPVYVDMSKLISDKEFANGVKVTDAGVVNGVVDTTSESFLTVGEGGFKLSGVQNAINAAKNEVKNADTNAHVTVSTGTGSNNQTIYTVNESDIQSATGFTTYTAATDVVIKTNKVTAATVNGVAATVASTTAGTSIDVTVDGDDVKVGDYTAVTYPTALTAETVATGDTLDSAINKVENGVVAVATKAVANASEIDAVETGAGLAADGSYTKSASANYIKDATSLADADSKLDDALKTVSDNVTKDKLVEVKVNDVTGTITTEDSGTKVSVALDGDDVKVDSYTSVTYDSTFAAKTGVAAVAKDDTLDEAINKVESSVKVLVDEVIADEATTAASIKALGDAAGTIASDGTIGYTANTSANYISEASSLADADDKLDAAIKATDNKLITAGTITGTNINTASTVTIDGQTINITANVDIPESKSTSGQEAIKVATGTDAYTVSLLIDPTEDDSVSLSQTGSGLKASLKLKAAAGAVSLAQSASDGLSATLALDNSEVTETAGGIQLTQSTNGLAAKLYWGTF